MSFNPLMQRLVSQAIGGGEGRAVCELGEQTLVGPKGERSNAADFYAKLGWARYVALDIAKTFPTTRVVDLDSRPSAHPPEPDPANILMRSFDLVTNNGTGEHIANAASVFEWMHELAKPSGLLLHVLPCSGWLNHGFYNFNPVIFRDLAAANDYKIEGLYLAERGGRLERIDALPGLDPFVHPKPHTDGRATPLERAISSFGERANVSIVALLRMSAAPGVFRLPIQGKYANAFADPAMAAARAPSAPASALVLPANATLTLAPFPHVVIRDALPADLYAELARTFPEPELFVPPNARPNSLHQLPAHKLIGHPSVGRAWQQFALAHCGQAWFERLMAVFGPVLAPYVAKLPSPATYGVRGTGNFDLLLDVQACVNTPPDAEGSVRGPHIDSPDELVAGLLYMPVEGDKHGGELILYESVGALALAGKAEVATPTREVLRVPYAPNTLIMFANGPRAIHGVSVRTAGAQIRRYANLLLNAAKPLVEMPPRADSVGAAALACEACDS